MNGTTNPFQEPQLTGSDAMVVVMFSLTILVVIYLVFLRRSSSE